jgi:hypothetical protein
LKERGQWAFSRPHRGTGECGEPYDPSIGIVCAPFKSLDSIFTFLDAFMKMENEGEEMQG